MFEISDKMKAEVNLLIQLKTADMVVFNVLYKMIYKDLKNNSLGKDFRSALDLSKNSIQEIVFSQPNNVAASLQFQEDMQYGRIPKRCTILVTAIELLGLGRVNLQGDALDKTILNLQTLRRFW